MSTKIEWTDATWNPIAGCNDVSEGCRNCYARTMARRLEAMGTTKYAGLTVLQGSKTIWTGKISFDEEALLAPLKRKKPTRYFVNSMSDLFHQNVTDEMRDRIFAVMALCPRHTFQVLTKRPERMLAYLCHPHVRDRIGAALNALWENAVRLGRCVALNVLNDEAWPLPNFWLGVSVENQKAADERIPLLLQTPAAKRFVSAEPLLGAIDLTRYLPTQLCDLKGCHATERMVGGRPCEGHCVYGSNPLPLDYLDWVIVGGESGHGARKMHSEWARSLRDQCLAAGVPFFFKQWGEWIEVGELKIGSVIAAGTYFVDHAGDVRSGAMLSRQPKRYLAVERRDCSLTRIFQHVDKKAAGRLLDGREWNEIPEAANV